MLIKSSRAIVNMGHRVKHLLLAALRIASWPFGLIPFAARRALLRALLLVESRIGQPRHSLAHLFAVYDDLDRLIAERATAYGGGVNPKHRLTSYHDFFAQRIPQGARVLDVGCGIGAVARTLAERIPSAEIVGIDFDSTNIRKARELTSRKNLSFIEGDATLSLPPGSWDTIILSNVIEHIADRSQFLRALVRQSQPRQLLVRVPLFERHWHMPLRRELGIDFRSDPTHHIEHTVREFEEEMSAAGLGIVERILMWGEIWARLEPLP